MYSKFRLFGLTVAIIVVFTLFYGMFSFGVFAAEISINNAVDNGVYLPLVMQPEPATPTPTVPPVTGYEDQVVALTNQERLAHGCGPVTMDNRLRLAAEGHSQDMALNDYFSHYAPDGTSPWDRIRAQGYSYSMAGENIAAGYPSPESVVQGWMNSDGHRANILNCGFIHIGVGYYYIQNDTGNVKYRHYWTQVFASP